MYLQTPITALITPKLQHYNDIPDKKGLNVMIKSILRDESYRDLSDIHKTADRTFLHSPINYCIFNITYGLTF